MPALVPTVRSMPPTWVQPAVVPSSNEALRSGVGVSSTVSASHPRPGPPPVIEAVRPLCAEVGSSVTVTGVQSGPTAALVLSLSALPPVAVSATVIGTVAVCLARIQAVSRYDVPRSGATARSSVRPPAVVALETDAALVPSTTAASVTALAAAGAIVAQPPSPFSNEPVPSRLRTTWTPSKRSASPVKWWADTMRSASCPVAPVAS